MHLLTSPGTSSTIWAADNNDEYLRIIGEEVTIGRKGQTFIGTLANQDHLETPTPYQKLGFID